MAITVNQAATTAAAKYAESNKDIKAACEAKTGNPDMAGSLEGEWRFLHLSEQEFRGNKYDVAVFANGDAIKILSLSALYKRAYDANGNAIEVKNPILEKGKDYKFETKDGYVASFVDNKLEVATPEQLANSAIKTFTDSKGQKCVLKSAKYTTFTVL